MRLFIVPAANNYKIQQLETELAYQNKIFMTQCQHILPDSEIVTSTVGVTGVDPKSDVDEVLETGVDGDVVSFPVHEI